MRELARRASLSNAYVSNVLSGKQEPGAKFYQGIARAFGVTLESVQLLEANSTIPERRLDNAPYRELIEIAQTLSDENLKEVLDYAAYRLWKQRNREVKTEN